MGQARVNPDGPLKGKVAIVTGASRGIGEAIAVRLAMEGARVIATARTVSEGESRFPGTLADTVARIRDAGGEATFIKADLTQATERARLVEQSVAAYGPVDILVNNAAVTFFMPVAEFPERRLKLMMEVQVYAPFHLSQLVLPSMRERRQGWIVNISSRSGLHPAPPYILKRGNTVYGMCKIALERFTSGLASEVLEDGIAVNAVLPGLVQTAGSAFHDLIDDESRGRVQPIEYIAEAAFRLASVDPKLRTGTICYAEPLLKELAIEPADLI